MKFPHNSASLVSGHVKLGCTIIQNTFFFPVSVQEKLTKKNSRLTEYCFKSFAKSGERESEREGGKNSLCKWSSDGIADGRAKRQERLQKRTAQECHHVDACGNDSAPRTERVCSSGAVMIFFFYLFSDHFFQFSFFSFFKEFFFTPSKISCQPLHRSASRSSSSPHLRRIKSKTRRFQRPPVFFFQQGCGRKKKECLKTSLTFRLSLKMTLPSTIACGNIIRPTLNFNWYAVPDSSRGNYHSVHNKSHNKHLENDFIIHSASIKVSYDPSETHIHTRTHARRVIVMKWKLYYAYDRMLIWWWAVRGCASARARLIGRCVKAAPQPWMEELWDLPSFLKSLSKYVLFFSSSLRQMNGTQKKIKISKNVLPFIMVFPEQGHATIGHSRLPVLSLFIRHWTWPPQL